MRIFGHLGRTRIYSNFIFFISFFIFRNIFLSGRGSGRRRPIGTISSLSLSLSLPECPPFYNPHPSPSSSPPRQPVPSPLIPPHPSSSSLMFSTSNPTPPPTPRPILKRSPSDRQRKHAVVHFPPSPIISKTFVAHSPSTYDRSPIVVVPNSCALPERGCPGRTYTLDRNGRRTNEFGGLRTLFGDESTDSLLPPPLVQDTSSSSSSDESSDGLAPLPPPFNSADSKHRKRNVRRHYKQPPPPLDHTGHDQVTPQYNRPSFSDSSLRSNLLADEGCFGGF